MTTPIDHEITELDRRRAEVEAMYQSHARDNSDRLSWAKLPDILGMAFFLLAYFILIAWFFVEGVIR